MGEKLLTAKEAAEILKVRKNTVYDMIKRGDLKASKRVKQLRIRQEDLDFYIQYGSQYGSQASTMLNEGKTQTNDIDKDEFEKIIDRIETAGYKVKNTGETSKTTRTTIINRNSISETAISEIKNAIKIGNISTGNYSENIDITIILGKDSIEKLED